MSPESFKELLDRYVSGTLSTEEREIFANALNKHQALLEAELESSFLHDDFEGADSPERKARLNKLILSRINHTRVRGIPFLNRSWVRLAAASILIVTLISVVYFNKIHPEQPTTLITKKATQGEDIAPGRSGATLTLADGSKIVLDSVKDGKLAEQSGSEVMFNANQLSYAAAAGADATVTYNTLDVPRGRQFTVVLPDGTKVWLNAASSLRYPTAFTASTRLVEITGEGYFEVAHNASKPFIVKNNKTEITVLGTHFNVHAYNDEDSDDITLLEGSVNVSNGSNNVSLKPGQQARVSSEIRLIDQVDTEEVVAWKDGKFQFGETADIKTVMHQISNWYDVDVAYNGAISKHIGGTISRDVNLSKLLNLLQKTGVVNFTVEGRTVTVSPQ